MCDFGISAGVAASIVASIFSAVAAAASTAIGVVSSIQEGNARQAEYNYQAEVAKQNAKIAQANADQKRQEGIEESRLQRLKTLQAVGSQQAAMAANGLDVSSGTALDIVEDTATMGELDALTTRYNYESQALGFEQQADNFKNQSNLDILAGQNAQKAGTINAAAVGFGGLSRTASVAADWYSPSSIGKKNTIKNTKATKVSGGIYGDNYMYV